MIKSYYKASARNKQQDLLKYSFDIYIIIGFFFQIDFLQQKTRELERKYQDCNAIKEEQEVSLSKSKITIRDQEARIQELELDLRDVDRMAKRLETDKNQVVRTADREMMEAKVGLSWRSTYYCSKWSMVFDWLI